MKTPKPYTINGVSGHRWDCDTNEEWREERSKSIGASAIGILIGENRFTTPMELAEKMRAELKGEFNYEQTLAMMRGHAYEQGVADLFSWQTGKEIIKSSSREYLLRRDDTPFMHASPDRTYWIDSEGMKHGKNSEGNKGILECKTTRRQIDPTELPASWIFQLQVQMGISGAKEGYIAWDVLTNADGFGYKRFEFDPELFEAAVEIIQNIKEMQQASKELTAEIDTAKSKLIMLFTDEEAIVSAETGKPIVTYKTKKGAMRVDSKLLKSDYPEVYEKVTHQDNDSRTLLIK